MEKTGAAILGSGNIGTDLMYKLLRSETVRPAVMAGVIPESEGLARARQEGLATTYEGIDGLLEHADDFEIVFDATTARAHAAHAPLLGKAGKVAVDLTPAAVGPYVIPLVNLDAHVGEPNVNLVSCGGQATVPLVSAMGQCAPVEYAEIVATIASKSAGPGTRQNIDEFTDTTARGLEKIGKASRGKAVIVLNPAEPPILMRNTVYGMLKPTDPEPYPQGPRGHGGADTGVRVRLPVAGRAADRGRPRGKAEGNGVRGGGGRRGLPAALRGKPRHHDRGRRAGRRGDRPASARRHLAKTGAGKTLLTVGNSAGAGTWRRWGRVLKPARARMAP